MPNFPQNSPFKLLEPYTISDSAHFFGREKEVIQFNEVLSRCKFVLLYGASGTGKTSLVQCGLSGMYSPRDWYPLFIRRNDDFIHSIHAVLNEAHHNWAAHISEEDRIDFQNLSMREKLKHLFQQSYRPIYLILDQFEEIFTLSGNKKEEVDTFFEAILALDLYRNDLFCKIIISCREEYIAHFYHYEKKVPFLFENRFRLEKMRDEQMLACIKGILTTPYPNYPPIMYSPGAELQLLNNLKNDRGEIELTELQIYADRLYREDLERISKAQLDRDHILLDKELIGTDSLTDVLNEFLDEQLNRINTLPDAQAIVERDLPLRMLLKFVTSEGTKKNLNFVEIQKEFDTGKTPFSTIQLQACLNKLLAPDIKLLNRLNLTATDQERYEIMHDRMAECVYKRLSGEEARFREALSILKNRYKRFLEEQLNNPKGKLQEFLSEGDLGLINQTIDAGKLDSAEQEFIRKSHNFQTHQKRNKSRRRFASIFLSIVVPISLAISIWKIRENSIYEQIRILVSRAEVLESSNPMLAKAMIDSAKLLDPKSIVALQAQKRLLATQQFYYFMKKFPGEINSFAMAEDGQVIAATYAETLLKLGAQGEILARCQLDTPILAMRLNRQNDGVYFADENQKVYSWLFNRTKPQLLGTLDNIVYGFDYHPAKDLLAVMDGNGKVLLWQNSQLIKQLPVFELYYVGIPKVYPDHTLAFNGDGSKIVSGTYTNAAIVFDLSGKILHKVQLNTDYLLAVDYSPVKDEILTCTRDGQAHIWDASIRTRVNETALPVSSLSNNKARINLGKFSNDGKMVLLGYTNTLINVWYVKRSVVVSYAGHQERLIGAAWDKKSRSFLSVSADSCLIKWNLASRARREFGPYRRGIEGLCYIPERHELIVASGTGEKDRDLQNRDLNKEPVNEPVPPQYIHRWQIGKPSKWRSKQAALLKGIRAVIPINQGKTVVFGGAGKLLYWWELEQDSTWTRSSSQNETYAICAMGKDKFAVAREDSIEIWSNTGKLLKSLPRPNDFAKFNCLAYNPLTQKLYCGIENFSESGLFEWNGRWICQPNFPSGVSAIEFSPDGQTLAVCSSLENQVYLSDSRFKQPVQKMIFSKFSLDGLDNGYDLAFSPDGNRLVVATKGSKAIVFDLNTYTEILILSDVYERGMFRVCFAPDGQSIYCGGGDAWVYSYKIP